MFSERLPARAREPLRLSPCADYLSVDYLDYASPSRRAVRSPLRLSGGSVLSWHLHYWSHARRVTTILWCRGCGFSPSHSPTHVAGRRVRPHAPVMFVVTEEDEAAIRAFCEQRGEFAAAIELRQRFPDVTDNAQARVCARSIAGWKPLPLRPVKRAPRLRRTL